MPIHLKDKKQVQVEGNARADEKEKKKIELQK